MTTIDVNVEQTDPIEDTGQTTTPPGHRYPRRALANSGEGGASLTEYALLVALIGVACLAAFSQLSGSQEGSIGGSTSKLTSAMDAAG